MKTRLFKQQRHSAHNAPVYLNGKALEEVEACRYLGSVIFGDNRLEFEISAKITEAAAAFGRLDHCVWKLHNLQLHTKHSASTKVISNDSMLSI